MEKDDVESFMPAAGSVIPSCRKTGYSRGANTDNILKAMDREDMLIEISKHPVHERKALLRAWYQRQRAS